MALTKDATTVVHNDITLTAGGGDTTSSSQDITDAYSCTVYVRLTNGGTGPTIPAQVQIEVSPDNSNWYDHGSAMVGTTTNSDVIEWHRRLVIDHKYFRTVSGSNTGQNVTLRVEYVTTSSL